MADDSKTTELRLIWPWQMARYWRTRLRDMEVRHARERAAWDAWIIECEYALKDAGL